jgi:hypothetical protein
MAFNDPGKDPVVKFTEAAVKNINDGLDIAPVTATIFEIEVE